jgi:hypothetical protein
VKRYQGSARITTLVCLLATVASLSAIAGFPSGAAASRRAARSGLSDVISGRVLAPSGEPVAGALVYILPSDAPPSDPSSWSPTVIGTARTDAHGIWTFVVPPYSALPADSRAAADNDGGFLNMDASVVAFATTASGATYIVDASAARSAFVGTRSRPSGPVRIAGPGGVPPAMVVTPDQADLSAKDTPAAERATWGYQNSPTRTNSRNQVIGDPANAYARAPTDRYGYQDIAGSNSDGYNPYIAADGVNLRTATVTAAPPASAGHKPKDCTASGFPHGYELKWFTTKVWKKDKHAYTIIGEYHINWDGTGSLSWEQDATASVGLDISANGVDFKFDYFITYSQTTGSESGPSGVPPRSAHQVSISLKYKKTHRVQDVVPQSDPVQSKSIATCFSRFVIKEDGLYNPGGGWQYIVTDKRSLLSHDGISGWQADFPKSYDYMNGFDAYEHLCDKHGKGLDYGFAASFGNVTIREETNHSADTEQCDYWGHKRRHDDISGKRDGVHYAWGSDKKAGNSPAVFYNY